MIVLGVIDSKPSAAAVLADGRILSAVAEERLCREKMATGVPRQAIDEALRIAGLAAADLDQVAIAQKVSVFQAEPTGWNGWFHGQQPVKTTWFDALASRLAPTLGRFPLAWRGHHRVKSLIFRDRVKRLPELLRAAHGITAPVRFYDHHFCHATSAYFTSGFDDALVLTLDGGGDGLSGSVYTARDGRLVKQTVVDSFNSLGNFYSYVTALCGFRAEKDEGKITGLAAVGRPRYADELRRFIGYHEPGGIRYKVPMYHASALRLLADALPEEIDRADLAASVQLVLEEVGVAFVRYWLRHTGSRNIALAGGVFANVKLNQRIHEIDEVERISIHPAMDDSGLSVGSALAAVVDAGGDARLPSCPLSDAYLGPGFTDAEIESAIRGRGFDSRRPTDIREAVARLLADGHVVARFWGRMEYGPRALGARSILYRTGDSSVNDWLNDRLKRTEFMPFAPATLADRAHDCFHGVEGAEDPARFMTVTFDCTEEMKRASPGVVHVDGTARPQLVDKTTAPDLHGILSAYHRFTGNPSIINTSFNMHEEPIVCTPDDALRAFELGRLDYLAIGDHLVQHPSAVAAPGRVVGEGEGT